MNLWRQKDGVHNVKLQTVVSIHGLIFFILDTTIGISIRATWIMPKIKDN